MEPTVGLRTRWDFQSSWWWRRLLACCFVGMLTAECLAADPLPQAVPPQVFESLCSLVAKLAGGPVAEPILVVSPTTAMWSDDVDGLADLEGLGGREKFSRIEALEKELSRFWRRDQLRPPRGGRCRWQVVTLDDVRAMSLSEEARERQWVVELSNPILLPTGTKFPGEVGVQAVVYPSPAAMMTFLGQLGYFYWIQLSQSGADRWMVVRVVELGIVVS